MAITFEEFSRRVDQSLAEFAAIPQDAATVNAQEVLGVLLNRIFNQGLATDGRPIGQYAEGAYKKKRERDGRQTGYVDLQMTGELFQSVDSGVDGNRLLIGFKNDRSEIAGHLEKKYGRDIFTVSNLEAEQAVEIMTEYIRFRVEQIIAGWQ
jgi:hypothetical protein